MINNSFSMSDKKVRRFGKLFKTIDFDPHDHYTRNDYQADAKGNSSHQFRPCGDFYIGGSKYRVTIEELRQIEETARRAIETIHRQYVMGIR